ncbi:MAG: hypothetical protein LLG44_01985 [Chloroflexi bacterium]|nr:hypothetical protein [Chloroflexota bacterium]
MRAGKWALVLINVLGGAAVLGSYAWGLSYRPRAAAILWGDAPQNIRQISTASMVLAALGYLTFTLYFLLLPADELRITDRKSLRLINGLYGAILLASALWMPLTWLAIEGASAGLLWVVRIDLMVVAAASLAMLGVLVRVRPRRNAWPRWSAVAGCIFFCMQTVVLDAIIWASYFHG